MRADGRLHRVEYPLWNAPAIIASHLKYKKHEWIVFAFEKDRVITALWTNKGPDGTTVSPFISHDRACDFARQNQCSSLLRLHNHPNPDPQRFRMLAASEQDTLSSNHLAGVCKEHKLNFADVVCERGFFHVFRFDAHESFMPLAGFENQVHIENGQSRYGNLRLHVERHF